MSAMLTGLKFSSTLSNSGARDWAPAVAIGQAGVRTINATASLFALAITTHLALADRTLSTASGRIKGAIRQDQPIVFAQSGQPSS